MILLNAVFATIPVFAQLSLGEAVSHTVSNSAAIAGAQAVVRQRQAQLQLARLAGVPHAIADYSLSPQANAPGTGTVEQRLTTLGAGISVNDLLAVGETTRQAAAELLASERDADVSLRQARTTAITLYFSALQAIAVEGIRADAVRGARLQREAAALRSRAGAAPRLDVVRADVTLAQAEADRARAEADRANAVAALASAAGVEVSSLSALRPRSGPEVARPSIAEPLINEDRAVARALAVRPELTALTASLQAQMSAIALAGQARWPSATFNAGYQTGVDTGIPVHGPQAALHVELPIDSGTRERVAVAQAQADAVRAELREQRRIIALDTAAAVRTLRAAQSAQTAADSARDEARRALQAIELGYREGASSSLDVDVARRTYVSASVDALVAEYQLATDEALLEALLQ